MAITASWLPISPTSPFSILNIPFGIISTSSNPKPRPAIAIGSYALDLSAFADSGGFQDLSPVHPHMHVFSEPALNGFAALGRAIHRQVREHLQLVLTEDTPYGELLKDNKEMREKTLIPLEEIKCHLPMRIGDYTDFYAGLNHAYNLGALLRGPDNALQPNYKHLPVGYHGRASSVVASGTPIKRPNGQILLDPTSTPKIPSLLPCKKLDIELEMGAFVSTGNRMGEPIPISKAEEHVFGLVLMNDWSARDVQAWEYVPLGPFNAKNFGTTISPWVVLLDALEPFRTHGLEPGNREKLLPYLREPKLDNMYDIKLEVELKTAQGTSTIISNSNSKNLLFSFPQMLTHHSITGCNMNPGDLLGSGTISGTDPGSLGSLFEQTSNGKKMITLQDGSERAFLLDGDEILIRGVCGQEGGYVGFGECRGKIEPAVHLEFDS
ncbi:MAG: hypothetical protein M1834_004930 [Cirrosporium novae-zelandiae]|nr:MAG: hypothetical protein M1834_004930 [Cirrosporium novae-zelandiae]